MSLHINTRITDLPLHVLHLVFKNLCIRDKLNLAGVNRQLQNAFNHHGSKVYTKISDNHPDVGNYLKSILLMCGSCIEHITISNPCPEVLDLVATNCSNLKSVKITLKSKKCVEDFKKILTSLNYLTSLNLVVSADPSVLLDNLKELQYLTILQICYMTNNVVAPELHKLERLKELTIESQNHLTIAINDISPTLRSLKCRRVNINSTNIAGDYTCEFLENLDIGFCHLRPGFPSCPGLQSLCILSSVITCNLNVIDWILNEIKAFWSSLSNSSTRKYKPDNVYYPLPYFSMLKSLSLDYDFIKENPEWVRFHAKSVEELEIHFKSNLIIFDMLDFPNLRKLSISSGPLELVSSDVYDWITRHRRSLQNLVIFGLEEEHFSLHMLLNCKDLRSISIGSRIQDYSNQFWMAFFDILEVNRFTADKPFILNIKNCKTRQKMRGLSWLRNSERCKIVFI